MLLQLHEASSCLHRRLWWWAYVTQPQVTLDAYLWGQPDSDCPVRAWYTHLTRPSSSCEGRLRQTTVPSASGMLWWSVAGLFWTGSFSPSYLSATSKLLRSQLSVYQLVFELLSSSQSPACIRRERGCWGRGSKYWWVGLHFIEISIPWGTNFRGIQI